MILGRKLRSFTATDSGIVAPGLRRPEPAAEVQAVAAVELTSAPAVVASAPATVDSFDEERQRLWGVIALLRRANARLRKSERRLTKENAALRSDLSGNELSVDSILTAGKVAQKQTAGR